MNIGILKARRNGNYQRKHGMTQFEYAVGPLHWVTTCTGYDLSGNMGGDHKSYLRDFTLYIIPFLFKYKWTREFETGYGSKYQGHHWL